MRVNGTKVKTSYDQQCMFDSYHLQPPSPKHACRREDQLHWRWTLLTTLRWTSLATLDSSVPFTTPHAYALVEDSLLPQYVHLSSTCFTAEMKHT